MASFKFQPLVNDPLADIITAPLGASAGATFTDKDINKAVKLGTGDKYVPCGDGDHIEGFVIAVTTDQPTVNSGYNLGSVQRNKRMVVQNATGAAQLAEGDMVVSATPLAVGTEGRAQVKKLAAAPADGTAAAAYITAHYGKSNWKVLSLLTGTGLATELVLIEKVSG